MIFVIDNTTDKTLDGIALWFDTIFTNKKEQSLIVWNKQQSEDKQMADVEEKEFHRVVLSTSPSAESTHWKQTLIFLPERLKVEEDDVLGFQIKIKPSAQNQRIYNIELSRKENEQCNLLRAMIQQQKIDNNCL